MDPQDDPEARVRDLERPLSDVARASEIGAAQPDAYPYPTPPPATYGAPYTAPPVKTAGLRGFWIVLAVFAVGAIALVAGVAVLGAHLLSSRGSIISSPSVRPSISRGNLTVGGIGQNRTIACNDSVVTVSGITNTIVLTGHCASLSVVGSQNVVTVDTADTIDASGIENHITFHSGSHNVANNGISNVVAKADS